MKFTIAIYGSFSDSNGYSWRIPQNLSEEKLEKIRNEKFHIPSDGRNIKNYSIFGGYYIDYSENLFYAYRSINGGKDIFNRDGVVITNVAITNLSEILGKNIELLFSKLSLTQLPKFDGKIDISLPDAISVHSEFGFINRSKELSGNEVHKIFNIPANPDCYIETANFILKGEESKATIEIAKTKVKSENNIITRNTDKEETDYNKRSYSITKFRIISLIVGLVVGFLLGCLVMQQNIYLKVCICMDGKNVYQNTLKCSPTKH